MKFPIDAQLPPRLVGWLVAQGHEARHVVDPPDGQRMSDAEIWRQAADGAVVVSKDKDLLDLAAVRGAPPVVLLLGVGNASTQTLLRLLDDAWQRVYRASPRSRGIGHPIPQRGVGHPHPACW